MSNLSVYSVSAVNTLSATYVDPYLQVKQYRTGYEQGFIFNRIKALSGLVDTTINNYTSQYLTGKVYLNDIFTINEVPIQLKTLTTPLIFNTLIGEENRYLYIYKFNNTSDPDIASARVLLSSFVGFENNINFELEILSDTYLRVKHNNGIKDYFLNVIENGPLTFYSYDSETVSLALERPDMFRYLLDSDGYLMLFKNTLSGAKIVTLSGDKLTLQPYTSGGFNRNGYNIIKVNYDFLNITSNFNNSWVSYNPNKSNELSLNDFKSSFNNKGQYVLTTNYNTLSNNNATLNYFTLNDFKSEKNYIKRGISTLSGSLLYPDVDFREYMSLQTGNSQEKGNDNISLTYVWYDKDIKVINGTDTYFTTPSSIYPFKKLNINDTKFAVNGAIGGRSPVIADKIFCLRGNSIEEGNGRYLCTWLSGGNSQSVGVWVDRYYYPDLILKQDALSGFPVYEPSFFDSVDHINFADRADIAARAFFDKKSDLVIEPNTKYYYSRVGSDDLNAFIGTTAPLASGFVGYLNSNNAPQVYSSNSIEYNGDKYNKFEVSNAINETNSFTISFDIYVDPAKKYGYQLLGNYTDKGFGVINDEAITPFLYFTRDNTLYVYNTDMVLINTITFDRPIISVIRGKNLEGFLVSCQDGYFYKVNALGIKTRLEVLPSSTINYINQCQDDDRVILLLNTSGDCIEINKNNFNTKEIKSTIIATLSNTSPTFESQKSITTYNGNVIGFPGYKLKHIDPENVLYLVNNELLIKQNIRSGEFTNFISSSTNNIIDFAINSKNEIAVANNSTKVLVVDQSRTILSETDYTQFIGLSSIIQTIDVVREYTNVGLKEYFMLTYVDSNNNLGILNTLNNSTSSTSITGYNKNGYRYTVPFTTRTKSNTTGFDFYKQYNLDNGLDFKLTLTNYLSSEDIVTKNIKFTFDQIDKGFHTFTYRFDSLQGNITLFVDGNIYKNITVQPGKYQIQEILSDEIYAGSTGFYNGLDLASYLNQKGYYFINGVKVKNLLIYNRPLYDSEVLAINLFDENIDDLVLSIPAGQRNNIEEIERYFKFSPISSSSKKINVYIKNSGITNEEMKTNIKSIVTNEVYKTLPVGVSINDIQFVDFK